MRSLFNFHSKHVKISEAGMQVLKNRQLTRRVVDAIIKNKEELDNGESVTVESNGQEISLSLSGNVENVKEKA